MGHYDGTEYIPTCVPSDISSRAPSIVPGTSPSHNTRLDHSFITISITTNYSIQVPIKHNSSVPYLVLTVEFATTYASMTQKLIIKESFFRSNINDYIYVL